MSDCMRSPCEELFANRIVATRVVVDVGLTTCLFPAIALRGTVVDIGLFFLLPIDWPLFGGSDTVNRKSEI